MNRNSNLIYFNNNRTTRIDEAVAETMSQFKDALRHQSGVEKKALEQLSHLLNCDPAEILLTSGTTESVNLAIRGVYELNKGKGKHIITNKTEHFAVLDYCEILRKEGAIISFLGVDKEGLIDPEELKAAITPETILISIMAANNETGVIQPIEKISEICTEKGIVFFTDASQYAGKMRCDVKDLGMDCLAFGAHKIYGPDGIGLLYITGKQKGLMDHIRKNYSSSLNTAQIAGFEKTAEILQKDYWENNTHISKLKNYFEHQLLDIDGLRINGSTKHRLYNTSNLTFPESKNIASLLNRFDFADNLKKPSYVLQAMGLSPHEIRNSYRFSFGKYNTMEEVKALVEEILK